MAKTRRNSKRAGIGDEQPALKPLDREQVVSAALILLDEVGLDGLSMRRLAERLSIKASTLYWYVRDKDELLALLADSISGEVQMPELDGPWRTRLESLLREYRRVLLAHRDSGRILAGTIPTGHNRLRLIDMTLGALLDAGLDGLTASRAGRLLVDYSTAFVLEEINESAIGDKTAHATGHTLMNFSVDVYPNIAKLTAELVDPDNNERFWFGIKILLDGLERQLDESHGQLKDNP
ncbi:TetR/AcrR family transcriptional regulator C-terminal domain-containing protein [Paenibacillus germinis]|nr:TetR/AcrR family transcriptional regulator C-terminal domain-containing protein [Paenibacillus germinis]